MSKTSFRFGRGLLLESMRRSRSVAERATHMFMMLAKKELICHAGDVIAHDKVPCFGLGKFFIGRRHRAGASQVENEKFFQTLHRAVAVLGDGRMVVDMGEEEALKLAISRSRSIAEASKTMGSAANVFDA